MKAIVKQACTGDAEVLGKVKPHYLIGEYADLYSIVYDLSLSGKLITPDTIVEAINAAKKSHLVEQYRRLMTDTVLYLPFHIEQVIDEYIQRSCQRAAAKLEAVGQDFTRGEAEEAVRQVYAEVVDLRSDEELPEFKSDLLAHVEAGVEGKSVPTIELKNPHLIDVFGDKLFPRFYIIGGRPSMGKSILVNNLVVDMMRNGHSGLYYTWDNSVRETTLKVTAAAADIPYRVLVRNDLKPQDMVRITSTAAWEGKLYITDKRPNQFELETHVDKMFRAGKKISFIVADYFTKWKLTLGKGMQQLQGYEAACDTIARVCQRFQIPFILLCQQNKEGLVKSSYKKEQDNERDEDRYVTFGLEQLSHCDRLAQDAYFIAGMEGYRQNQEKTVFIAKDKDNPTRRVKIYYNGASGTMRSEV
jgi:replicative DNA helicase